MSKSPYQLAPDASKGNAFCWLSGEPAIKWRSTQDNAAAQTKAQNRIDAKRAAAIDPLDVRRANTSVTTEPLAFSRLSWKKRAAVG